MFLLVKQCNDELWSVVFCRDIPALIRKRALIEEFAIYATSSCTHIERHPVTNGVSKRSYSWISAVWVKILKPVQDVPYNVLNA